MEKINLFFLPFAGGNKYSYRSFEDKFPSFINIISLEYPGRGSRIREPLLTDISILVSDLYAQMKPFINTGNYAVYGHSMGGLVACLVAREIVKNHYPRPLHLFITGTSGPSAPFRDEKKRHLLDKSDFLNEIKNLDGSPEEVLNNEDLLDFMEPILRADFQASENYIYTDFEQLDIPFTVITGTEEDMDLDDIYLWQKESALIVDFKRMPGKHFFIFKYALQLTKIISKKLYEHSKLYANE